MPTDATQATAFFPTDRELAQMSISELTTVYDALQLASEAMTGVMIRPNNEAADTDSGMNMAGDVIERLDNELLRNAERVVAAAMKLRDLDQHDRARRARLFYPPGDGMRRWSRLGRAGAGAGAFTAGRTGKNRRPNA